MLKTLSVIIYLISFILIFQQIFSLTHFVYKYNNYFDYGKILQNICKNEYIERETSRFHIALNEKNILLLNNNKNNYYKLLLIISILFTSVISIIFSLIIYNIYCNINIEELNKYKIQHKIYILIILSICIITIIYPILLIFYKLKELKYRKNISLFETNRIDKLMPFIYIFIGLIILKVVLIYYKYKVPNFEIINESNENINELILFCIYGIVYMGVIYYITNFIVIYNYYNENININDDDDDSDEDNKLFYYINKVIGFKEHNKYINKISSIVKIDNTLNERKENKKLLLPNKLNNIDDIPEINKKNIYDSILNSITKLDHNKLKNIINNYIILYIKENYTDNLIKKTDENGKREVEINLVKKIKIELKEKFPNEDVDFLGSIILQKIILEIDYLIISIINNKNPEVEENNNKKITLEKETIFRRNLSGIIFILIIFLLIIGIIQLILKKYNLDFLHKNINIYILIPVMILFILLFIINSTIEYNILINKYIVKNPIEIYKTNINNINDSFNILLEDEYYKYLNKKFKICKNVRNSIIQVLLSNILYFNLLNNNNDVNILIEWNKLLSTDIKINDEKCNNQENEYDEFKFDSCIIRNNCNSINIFYGRDNNIDNCNLLNYTNIKKLIKNLLIFDNIDFTEGVEFVNIKDSVSDNEYELNKDEIFNNITEGKNINIKSNEFLRLIELNNINKNNYYMYNLKLDKNNYRIKDDEIFNKLLREIYLKTTYKNIENISDYILYDIIYNNNIYSKFKSRIEYVKNNLKNIIYTSLYNSIILENNKLNREYIVNENNIKNYIINDYENHNSLKQYNNIVNNIVNKYINLLIKNIYLLSKLLNANNNILELGELYNKLIDEPNIGDKNKRNYISLEFKTEIISYINNLVKEITIYFDDINKYFKLNSTNYNNVLNNYIINNYNNINENNIYTKDIILPYLEKNVNNNQINKKKLENLLTIIDLNNKNYNNLRKYICEKEYNINNECKLNNFKLDIKNIKKDIIDNIYYIKKFTDEYNIIKKNKEMIEFLDNLNIQNENYKTNNIINILNQIANNYNKLNKDEKGLRNIYETILKELENINTEEKSKELKLYIKENLYTNNFRNIELYSIIKNTLDNTEIIKGKKNNNPDKNTSIQLNNNINQVNKSLLILIIVYIISILLINYIR